MFSINSFTDFKDIKGNWTILEKTRLKTPFQSVVYQEIFVNHFLKSEEILILSLFDKDKIVGIGSFIRQAKTISFLGMQKILGNEEVTDFGDILVNPNYSTQFNVWDEYLKFFKQQNIQYINLDYVREDSLTYQLLTKLAKGVKAKITFIRKTVSPYIRLSGNWESHFNSLDRVKRKELKRKINRLQNINYEFIVREEITSFDFTEFIRLHRLSDPAKNKFMSEEMKKFFQDLVNLKIPNWKINLCFLKINKVNTAALLYFTNGQTIFLYNSGYDPEFGFYSVGLLLAAILLKKAIKDGYKIYDFLRGNERYKYDLGAQDNYLYNITIKL